MVYKPLAEEVALVQGYGWLGPVLIRYLVAVEALGMWESRRDFQEEREGWKTAVWFSMLSTPRHFQRLLSWAKPGPKSHVVDIEFADFQRAEIHSVEVLLYFFKRNIFTTEDLADKDPALMPTDVSRIVHAPCLEVSWVLMSLRVPWQEPRARDVNAAWSLVPQSFMRTLMVVDANELIETLLLRMECFRRRVRSQTFSVDLSKVKVKYRPSIHEPQIDFETADGTLRGGFFFISETAYGPDGLPGRLANAFTHAVELCTPQAKPKVKHEPF